MDIKNLIESFEKLYGTSSEKIRFFTAPGRVNLIGEHIDYCGGYVFPAALTLSTTVAVRLNGTDKINMAATDLEGIFTCDLNDIEAARNLKWGNYQAGMVKELKALGYDFSGMDMLFTGTLPFGSGLSSSASIEMATGIALCTMANNASDISTSNVQIAIAGKACENNFCGVNCGIMDQFASAMGKKNHAMLLNCAEISHEYVPLDLGQYVLVLANTCKKHSLGASKYNERRAEVAKGLELMNMLCKDSRDNLCDYTTNELEAVKDGFKDKIIYNRVYHVITENQRVKDAVEVLKAGDLVTFGKILCAANDSIRYNYEVTGDELDAMFDAAATQFEGGNVLGSRMTGAGFGGCTVNIVKESYVDEFIKTTGTLYTAKTGITPEFYVCSIGDGAREITG